MKKKKKKKVRNIICTILSFFLALFIFADVFCVFTVSYAVNENVWIDQMNSSNYYSDKADEIKNRLVSLGNASGLPPEFFDGVVDPVQISKDTQAYMDSYFEGKNEVVYSSGFKQNFSSELERYIADNKVKTDDKNIDYLVDEAEHVYLASLKIPLLYRLSDYISQFRRILPFAIAGLSAASAVIVIVLFLCNKWKHRSVKYLYFAGAGTCLSLLAVSAVLSFTGGLKSIVLESRALYGMAVSFGTAVTIAFWALTAFFFILSIVLYLIYGNMVRKVTSDD